MLEDGYRDVDECGACLLILKKQQIAKSKERIDSCLSGSEFVNPFFAFSNLLFFLV